jgi:hypothetical protein
MMKPQAYEALQKAKALFRHPAEVEKDDIPAEATAVEPIRKPRVVLIPPTDAPKFTKETMKADHKQEEVHQAFAKMSVRKAVEKCMNSGIDKPARIAELTGKKVDQVYTALWAVKKKQKVKASPKFVAPKSLEKADAMLARKKAFEAKSIYDEYGVNTTNSFNTPPDDFDPRREPTAWEDAHMVVLKSREQYETEIAQLHDRIGELLLKNQELNVVIKYLEGRTK